MGYYGPYRALVVNNGDPESLNRIQVQIPQIMGGATSGWAFPIPVDVWQPPSVGSQVLVTFEGGDLAHPLYYADSVGVSKSYIDAGDSSTLSSAKSYADSGDATTLSSAEAYANSGDSTTLASAKSYADTGDSNTLASAKSYTDTSVAPKVIIAGDLGGTPSVPTVTGGTHHTHTGSQISGASTSAVGVVQLAGDLGGTSTVPTVVSGANHTHTGSQVGGATTTGVGVVQLAGDIGGTSTAPTVVSGVNHTHTSAQISDATTVGMASLTKDTGWVNLTPASGYKANSDVPQVRQIGSVLYFRGTFGTSSGANLSGTAVVGNIPSSISWPSVSVSMPLNGSTGTSPMRGYIGTDGSITVTAPVTGSCNYVAMSGTVLTG